MISLIIPCRNNLKYVRQAYISIRNNIGRDVEIGLLDDASTDGSWEWMNEVYKNDHNIFIYRNEGPERVGHTVLYDIGVKLCSNEIFGIFHSDMVASPNYFKNILKHLQRGVVVSGTRIEPPLHPPGREKIVLDFGFEPEHFDNRGFLEAVQKYEIEYADLTSNGIFAPWVMYKEDFINIGGHDKLFAPMELEDSDIFNRFHLAGYKLIQSRDAFVYHMTCRGSRFKDGIEIEKIINLPDGTKWHKPKDSEEYTKLRNIKFKEWWRKWKTNVLHDEDMFPIVGKNYKTAFIIVNCDQELIKLLEPWCDEMRVDCNYEEYLVKEQPNTMFDLSNKFGCTEDKVTSDVSILFDGTSFNNRHYTDFISNLPFIIENTGQAGVYNWDRFIIRIDRLEPRDMIKPYFKNIF